MLFALDCCAGAGGLSLGLERAGFETHGVELDPFAAEAHRRNVGPCDIADLWSYTPPPLPFALVAGGIPCQSHSSAGKRTGMCDPRGQLYVPFLGLAQQVGARAVLIENVRGMLTSKSATHATSIDELVDAVRAAGFEHTAYRVLDAADFGVAQRRHRLFLVGFTSHEAFARFEWPRPTHAKRPTGAELPHTTIRAALNLPPGEYPHGRLPNRRGWQGVRILDVDGVSSTVTGHNNNDLIHMPDVGPVRLGIPQLRAPQGLPDDFVFCGRESAQHKQVGNAVPPALGQALGAAVHHALS